MADYADRAYLIIDGTVVECKSITPKGSNNAEPVKTMNRANRAKGFAGGVPDFEISAVVPQPIGGHVVDFDQLMADRTRVSAIIEVEEGPDLDYSPALITDVEHGAEEGSSLDTTLTMRALDGVSS